MNLKKLQAQRIFRNEKKTKKSHLNHYFAKLQIILLEFYKHKKKYFRSSVSNINFVRNKTYMTLFKLNRKSIDDQMKHSERKAS